MNDPFFDEDDGEFDDLYEQPPPSSPSPEKRSKQRKSEAPAAPVTTPRTRATSRSPAASSSVASRSYARDRTGSSNSATTDLAASGKDRKRRTHRRKGSQELFEVKWEADAGVKTCGLCQADFSLARRKHHCRHCGRVMCGDCSAFLFFEFSKRKHRVCAACNSQLLEQQEEFERDTMLPGASEMTASRLFEDSSDDEKFGAGPLTPASSDVGDGQQNKLYSTLRSAITPKHNGAVDEKARRKQEKRDRKEHKKKEKEERKRRQSQGTTAMRPDDTAVDDAKQEKPLDSGAALFNATDDAWFTDVPEQSMKSGDDDLDKSMTLDELNLSEDESHKFTPAVPRPTTPVNTTFYDDDADKLVVDDSPGFFEATVTKREAEKKKEVLRQQRMASDMTWVNNSALPSTALPHRFSTEQESYSLVDPPSHTSNSPVEKKEDTTTPGDAKGKKGGFAGALKRFFGMGARKTEKAKTPPRATVVSSIPAVAPFEKVSSATVSAAVTRHPSSNNVLGSGSGDTYLARHTVVDFYRENRDEPASQESFRYTMGGYVDAKSANTHFEPLVSTQAGNESNTYDDITNLHPKAGQSPKRRDTFDGLFDSPKNNLAANGAGRYITTGTGWGASAVEISNFGRVSNGASAVGVARFDERRSDGDDDGFVLEKNSSQSRIKSFHNSLDARRSSTAMSTAGDVKDESSSGDSRLTWSNVQTASGLGMATYAVPTSLRPRAIYDDNRASSYQRDTAGESSAQPAPMGSIMDDLKRGSSSKEPRVKETVDDFFAEFEERNDYVFDPATGGYVASAPPRAAAPPRVIRAETSEFDTPTVVTEKAVPISPKREHYVSSNQTDASTTLTLAVKGGGEEEVGDEVADIIVDKISSLEGELAALKQLIRNRKGSGGNSQIHKPRTSQNVDSRPHARKESIFDNDSSEDEGAKPTTSTSWRDLKQKPKRRPGSKKKFAKKRKDSFADLFDDSSDEKETLGTATSYEALFETGSKAASGEEEKSDEDVKRIAKSQNARFNKSRRRSRRKSSDLVATGEGKNSPVVKYTQDHGDAATPNTFLADASSNWMSLSKEDRETADLDLTMDGETLGGATSYDALFQTGGEAKASSEEDKNKEELGAAKPVKKRSVKMRRRSSRKNSDLRTTGGDSESDPDFVSLKGRRGKSSFKQNTQSENDADGGINFPPEEADSRLLTPSPPSAIPIVKTPSSKKQVHAGKDDPIDALFDTSSDRDVAKLYGGDANHDDRESPVSQPSPIIFAQESSTSLTDEEFTGTPSTAVARMEYAATTRAAVSTNSHSLDSQALVEGDEEEEFSINWAKMRSTNSRKRGSRRKSSATSNVIGETEVTVGETEKVLLDPISLGASSELSSTSEFEQSDDDKGVDAPTHLADASSNWMSISTMDDKSVDLDLTLDKGFESTRQPLYESKLVGSISDALAVSESSSDDDQVTPLPAVDTKLPLIETIRTESTSKSILPATRNDQVEDLPSLTVNSSASLPRIDETQTSRKTDTTFNIFDKTGDMDVVSMVTLMEREASASEEGDNENKLDEEESHSDNEPFSFEIQTSKTRAASLDVSTSFPEAHANSNRIESSPPSPSSSVDDDNVAFGKSGTSSALSSRTPSVDGSVDDPEDAVVDEESVLGEVESQAFNSDWQQMQAKEKERKKRLQLKQRQAQREKVLRKQGGSSKTVSGSSATHGSSKSKSKSGKKKKKEKDDAASSSHHKKSGSSSRKHHRHRDKDETADDTAANPPQPPRSLTEL